MSTQKQAFLEDIRQEELHVVDFMKVWFKFDKNKSGYLEPEEVKDFLSDLLSKKGKLDRLEADYNSLMKHFDTNQDGKIELQEFSQILPVENNFLQQFADDGASQEEEYTKVFEHYDKDNSKSIEAEELIAFLRDLKKTQDQEPTSTELEAYKSFILSCCDENSDGKVSFEELKLLLVG